MCLPRRRQGDEDDFVITFHVESTHHFITTASAIHAMQNGPFTSDAEIIYCQFTIVYDLHRDADDVKFAKRKIKSNQARLEA